MQPINNQSFEERHHGFILALIVIVAIIAVGWYVVAYKPFAEGGDQNLYETFVDVDSPDYTNLDSIQYDLDRTDIELLPQ